MREETIKLYTFEELNQEAQQKALEKFYDINVDWQWWEFVCEDAKEVDLKISAFDFDRGWSIDIKFIQGPKETALAILENHGKESDTYKEAASFLKNRREGKGDHEYFLQQLGECYLDTLQREYEYRTSEEAIKEGIICNEYEFLEDGKLWR
jgi:hypothetical protein